MKRIQEKDMDQDSSERVAIGPSTWRPIGTSIQYQESFRQSSQMIEGLKQQVQIRYDTSNSNEIMIQSKQGTDDLSFGMSERV